MVECLLGCQKPGIAGAKRESYVVHFDPCVLATWVKEIRRLCAQASMVTRELLGNSGNGCKVMVGLDRRLV